MINCSKFSIEHQTVNLLQRMVASAKDEQILCSKYRYNQKCDDWINQKGNSKSFGEIISFVEIGLFHTKQINRESFYLFIILKRKKLL